jgi:hypothetical protein
MAPVDFVTPAPMALTALAPTASVPPVTAQAGPALAPWTPAAPVDPVTLAPTALTAPAASVPTATAPIVLAPTTTAAPVSPVPMAQKYLGHFIHFVKKSGTDCPSPRGCFILGSFCPRIILS